MGFTGTETGAWWSWLRESEEQARKAKRCPDDRAHILAACLLKGIWILNGRSKVDDVKFQYAAYTPDSGVYADFEARVRAHAKNNCVADQSLEAAFKAVEKLQLPETLALASQKGIYEMVAPEILIVMDVMQQ